MSRFLFPEPVQTLSGLLGSFFITALTLSFTLLPVQSYAQGFYQDRSVSAGIYLRIPFGPTKKNDDRLKYGLRLNMSQEFSNSSRWNGGSPFESYQTVNVDLMSLNFSERGFRDLSFAGRQTLIYRNGILRAAGKDGEDGKEEEGGTSTFVWVLATIGVVTAGAIAAVAIELGGSCGNGSGVRAKSPCK